MVIFAISLHEHTKILQCNFMDGFAEIEVQKPTDQIHEPVLPSHTDRCLIAQQHTVPGIIDRWSQILGNVIETRCTSTFQACSQIETHAPCLVISKAGLSHEPRRRQLPVGQWLQKSTWNNNTNHDGTNQQHNATI